MSNLKEIRTRIASVESTQKITSAMKLVSAAKLRRAQNAIVNFRPYSKKLNTILQDIFDSIEISEEHPFFAGREPENVVLVVITSNRGLCGAFNSNIIKEVHRLIHEKYNKQFQEGKLKLICIGKKGAEQLQKEYNIIHINESLPENPNYEEASKLASELIDNFTHNRLDKIELIYNSFVNPATQKITVDNYLPVIHEAKTPSENIKNKDFIFEPSQELLLNELLPKILKIQFYKTLLDSVAAEHGARMTAMAKATDNAIEILKELKLKYNNARQAAITNELNEIVSGAEALKN
ncbi:MAG: ATP synthase F1 subunit gamma [Bacteroidetes bacterium]|nr:ATP synthase F1 subunit gamma [Bacteroidota bacterium]MCL1969786.1 ATP synthase F1 subunit gamma [Bacteroidota bacterium]